VRGRRATAALLAAALVLAGCAGGKQRADVGKPAPAIEAESLVEGERVDLASFRGRPVLVNFWGSWCDPCRKELPRLVEAERAGTAVLGVAVRDSRRRALEMLDEYEATWPSAHDPDERISRTWGVGTSFPVTYAVDAGGVIRARHFGEMRSEDVATLVKAAG
jgi:cytochrome c biogenesis protein CcmG/thiol:disulfide interchange protein DsbE